MHALGLCGGYVQVLCYLTAGILTKLPNSGIPSVPIVNDHCRNAAIDLRVNAYVMRQRISFCPNEQVLDDGNVNKYGRLLNL